MGLVFNRPKFYDFGKTQSEYLKHIAEKKKRDAAIEYGKQIKSDYFPKIPSNKTTKPLPIEIYEQKITTRRQNLNGLEYSKKLASVGNLYMSQSKKRIKQDVDRSRSQEEK